MAPLPRVLPAVQWIACDGDVLRRYIEPLAKRRRAVSGLVGAAIDEHVGEGVEQCVAGRDPREQRSLARGLEARTQGTVALLHGVPVLPGPHRGLV